MEESLGEFNLIKPLCSDEEKQSYLAEHKILKTPYIVQVLKKQEQPVQEEAFEKGPLVYLHQISRAGSSLYAASELECSKELESLESYILKQADFLNEERVLDILFQMASALNQYYLTKKAKSFGLKLESCFIDASLKVILIDHAEGLLLSFTNPQNTRAILEDTTLIAFGQIAYFVMTGQWPEGYFPLPSEINLQLDKKWDEFIKAALHHNPRMRLSSFFDILTLLERFKKSPVALKPLLKPAQIQRPEFEPNPGLIFQQELVVAKYAPTPKDPVAQEPLLTEMIVIPSGSYTRGSLTGARDEAPSHVIQLSPFALDIHPVTNEQFVRFLEVMGGEKDVHNNDMIRLKESRIKKTAGKWVIESGYTKHPVVGISWYGASAYAGWVGKRLPTEAEWEVAASSLKGDPYPTGESIEKAMANFFSSDTSPVMHYPPSVLGLYDMAGNVYEWCQDWYGYNYYEVSVQEPLNPIGPQQGVYRVLRGGCWKSLKEDLRVSHRHRNNPGAVNGAYGFRCAADVQ